MSCRLLVVGLCALLAAACHKSRMAPDGGDGSIPDGGFMDVRIGHEAGPAEGGGFDVFVDPGCDGGPLTDGAVFMRECDPFAPACPPGTACYAGVVPPEGPCGEEVFVTVCAPEGPGEQGDPCLGHTDCSAGHVCVVTGAGTQCVLFCDLAGGEPHCPRGLICRSTDVPGYGGCF